MGRETQDHGLSYCTPELGGHPPTHLKPRLFVSVGRVCCLPNPCFTFIEDCQRLPVAGVQTAGSNGKPGWNGEAGDGETGGDIARGKKLVVE